MKKRLHIIVLLLFVAPLVPASLLALLFVYSGVSLMVKSGFSSNDFMALIFFCIPPIIAFWGIKILLKLRNCYSKSVRKSLLYFYSFIVVFAGLLLGSTFVNDGVEFMVFDSGSQIIGACIVLAPLIFVLVSKQDVLHGEDVSPTDRT